MAPSSSGLGRRPLKAVAWVQIPSGLLGRSFTRVEGLSRFETAARSRGFTSVESYSASTSLSVASAQEPPDSQMSRSMAPGWMSQRVEGSNPIGATARNPR